MLPQSQIASRIQGMRKEDLFHILSFTAVGDKGLCGHREKKASMPFIIVYIILSSPFGSLIP